MLAPFALMPQGGECFDTPLPATIRPPTRRRASKHVIRLILLVTVLASLVHWRVREEAAFAASTTAEPSATEITPKPTTTGPAPSFLRRNDLSSLPRPVSEMIDAIIVAVNSGEIDDLRTAIEWNELPPAFGPDRIDDPIGFLKEASADKSGRQMLAILGNMLSVGPARQPIGRDPENTGVFVWPYLAERPLDALTPAEEVDLYRLVPADEIARMRETKRWSWYRLVIGADGTWHAFMRHE